MITIENIGTDENGQYIDGRICRGPIRLGHVFSMMVGHSKEWDRETNEWIDIDPGPDVPVHLKVTRMEAYRRTFEELHEGMTCRMHLDGDEFDRLAVMRILK